MSSKTATRDRILAVAPELLRRFTLSKFSMEDVARAAGIARQTVYKHFSTRDDLLITLFVDEMLENHAPKMAEVVSLPPSEENLLDVFMTELTLARAYPLFDEVLDPGMAPKMAELVFRSGRMAAAREQVWIPVLERYRDHGVLRTGLDLAATVRWISYQEYWLLTHPTVLCDDDQVLRAFVRDFVVAALVVPA
ncbi:TetR/AcrR family transcriptional regulator [Streptomyces sp. bgisy034]|uniref:TetR/AcrR family transcriptional regulator n=1 Tax=Streptomyces sp. bgisy034 TaxID=3413774 RepID=UPI003EBE0E5B